LNDYFFFSAPQLRCDPLDGTTSINRWFMGLFWDLIQQSQISRQEQRSGDLAGRVAALEAEVRQTQKLLHDLIVRLEERVGADLNRDGKIG